VWRVHGVVNPHDPPHSKRIKGGRRERSEMTGVILIRRQRNHGGNEAVRVRFYVNEVLGSGLADNEARYHVVRRALRDLVER